MASESFKKELARKMKELYDFVKAEYPDLYYISPSYMAFEPEEEIPDNVHVYLSMKTTDTDYIPEDSDRIEDTEVIDGKLEYSVRFDVNARGGEF